MSTSQFIAARNAIRAALFGGMDRGEAESKFLTICSAFRNAGGDPSFYYGL